MMTFAKTKAALRPTVSTLVAVLCAQLFATSLAFATTPAQQDEDMKALKTELMVSKTETQAMKQLDKLLGKYRGTPMEAGLWLRKAELLVRQSKTERFFELSRDNDVVVRFTPQRAKSASSKKYLNQAVDTYDMIARRFPKFDDLDIVLFNNAFARQQLNQEKLAENLYRDLIRRFPSSVLIPDSRLALGEMHFDRQEYAKALVEFEAIKEYPESRVYPYGLFKTAWTKYNLKDVKGGLLELEAVVAFGKKVEAESLDSRLDLRAEALNDMVLFYSDTGDPAKALAYFTKQANEKDAGSFLIKLAALYVRHGKHGSHDIVLREFIEERQTAAEIPIAFKSLVENYELQRQRDKAVKALSEMSDVCDENSKWSKANRGATACKENTTKISLYHANKWHRMYKKNQTYPEFAKSAETAYKIYLKFEPKGEESYQNRFALAELLFQLKKYRESGAEYYIVGRDTKDLKLSHDAAYASVVSLEKAVGDKWSTDDEQILIQYAGVYIKRHPTKQYAQDLKFKLAFVAYDKGRYKDAAPILYDIGWNKTNSVFKEKSQSLYLDILNIQKDYKGLRVASQGLLKQGLIPAREKSIRKIFEEASFAEAQELSDKGEHFEAAEAFESFSANNTNSDLADKAWWNAINLYTKLNMVSRSTEMCELLPIKFPKSTYKKEALIRTAQGYEQTLELAKAAKSLENLAALEKESEIKWTSLAADFYALSGKADQAKTIYRRLTKSRDSGVSTGAYAKLLVLESEGKPGRKSLLIEIANSNVQPQASLAQAEIAEAELQAKKLSEAFRSASRVLEMSKQGASSVALSQARFVQASILDQEFRSQSVKSRPDRLQTVLQIKTEKLDKVSQAYQDVLRYKTVDKSVEALYELSRCYAQYVDALRNIEIMGDISKEDLATVRKELENIALPMEDKRIELLESALKLAKDTELRNGSIGRLQVELNKANLKKTNAKEIIVKLPDPQLPRMSTPIGLGAL